MMEAAEATEVGKPPDQVSRFYAKGALQFLVPELMVRLTKQDEFDEEGDEEEGDEEEDLDEEDEELDGEEEGEEDLDEEAEGEEGEEEEDGEGVGATLLPSSP